MQRHQGLLHPLSYVSKSLNPAQRNYSATKLEALALVFSLETYRNIILNYPITVFSDHRPLTGIMKKKTKDACINRWTLMCQEYAIDLQYLPGKNNVIADALSRLPQVEESSADLETTLDNTLTNRVHSLQIQETPEGEARQVPEEIEHRADFIPVKSPFSFAELRAHQEKDAFCREIIGRLKSTKPEKNSKLASFKLLDKVLFVTRQITRANYTETHLVPYVPNSLIDKVFKVVHEEATAGHHDLKRTLRLFVRNYFNKNERQLMQNRIENCEPCIRAKKSPKNIPLGLYPVPNQPFTTWSVDLLGPLPTTVKGHKYILVTRDYTTRYTVLQPLTSKDADQLTGALRETISHYGSPQTILSDNAAELKSETMIKFCRFYNIQKVQVAPYHPQSQGLAERVNREVNKMIRILSQTLAVDDWDELLNVIQLSINNSLNSSIGDSPFYMLYGFDSPTVTFAPPRLNYGETDGDIRLRRIADIRKYCRDRLEKIQRDYTD